MPNHAEGNGRTGRNVALPEENRPSWSPQEDDRYEEDRRMRHWDDRERRDWDRDDWRYGHQDDRSTHFQSRDQGYAEDRYRERGMYGAPRGYGYNDGGYGMQRESSGGRGATGHGGMYGQGGYDEGMHGSGGMQHRYGSQGYQGYRGGPISGGHRGKGPASYQRSDERIREAVCEALTDDDRVDATNIEVTVKGGEVTLSGTVDERHMKRIAEDLVEGISGVKDVQNQVRIASGSERRSEGRGESQDKSRHRS